MLSKRLQFQRYQLNKEAVHAVLTGHPWVYRKHLSLAVDALPDGQWLRLFGGGNEVLGYGVFEKEGLIGIRVFKQGSLPPDPKWFSARLEKALSRRENLRLYTDAFRAIHGENDGFPGVVVDVYGKTAVLQTYSAATDVYGRVLAGLLHKTLGFENLIWKLPVKRKSESAGENVRVLRGKTPSIVKFREGKMEFTVQIGKGQKSGSFLDLRGLRKWVSLQKWQGKKVLNLFAYTGALGRAAEVAGAKEIWNVDISSGALEFGREHHASEPSKFKWVIADIFDWVTKIPPKLKFDVIIVDPPLMASRMKQTPNALRAYHKIYNALLPHLTPNGTLVACCCTSRLSKREFRQMLGNVLGNRGELMISLSPEDDHPVGFPEGDYLKLLAFRVR